MDPLRRPNDRRRVGGPWEPDAATPVVDGYRTDGVPWPIETTRYAYMTPYGGQSDELAPGMVGINRQALAENTELSEGDSVVITSYDRSTALPYMFRAKYEVVPLDFGRPDGFLHSLDGEAVLSTDEPELERGQLARVAEGVRLVLNGVLGRFDAKRFGA